MQLFNFSNNTYLYLKINIILKNRISFLFKQFHYFSKNIVFYFTLFSDSSSLRKSSKIIGYI